MAEATKRIRVLVADDHGKARSFLLDVRLVRHIPQCVEQSQPVLQNVLYRWGHHVGVVGEVQLLRRAFGHGPARQQADLGRDEIEVAGRKAI